jgi:hypothetical protein
MLRIVDFVEVKDKCPAKVAVTSNAQIAAALAQYGEKTIAAAITTALALAMVSTKAGVFLFLLILQFG